MNIIFEFDGVLTDQQAAWYEAHVAVTQAVGWSGLNAGTFWRLMRTKGRQADVLPAARPGKVEEYWSKFDELIESDEWIGKLQVDEDMSLVLHSLIRHGELRLVTLGGNLSAREKLLVRHQLGQYFKQFERLNADPRRRPAELTVLAKINPRTIVVAGSEMLARSASLAELVCVGISSGSCTGPRLFQAGAQVVYKELPELVSSLQNGARDLIQAGLLPRSLDAPTG